MSNDVPAITYQGEKTRVAGTVIDGMKGTPVANATLKFNDKQQVQTCAPAVRHLKHQE